MSVARSPLRLDIYDFLDMINLKIEEKMKEWTYDIYLFNMVYVEVYEFK